MNWRNLRTGPQPCPECGAPWKLTEITGAARHGGGYRLLCHGCEHRWDDPHASHGERHTARRSPPSLHLQPPTTWVDVLTEHPQI